ncbi:hypothetical protein Syun_011667 [Stephania yunnanensis]|uniref:Uncharacterized protein n=1 Tax=Stephania yunnanensis TaxID=152371 RepID=A0AAP0PFN6_9MAGN
MKEALTIAMSRLQLVKVLKKLDMIRKNDIERILAEMNILITVRNPFVSRFIVEGLVGDFGEEGVDIVQWAKVKTNWSKEGVVKILDER